MTEHEKKTPQGVVAILVDKNGKRIADSTDFQTGFPAGFTQREIQECRAKSYLAMYAVKILSSTILSDAISQYEADQILRNMCKNGCSVIIVPVGYDD